jgi:hypothetical protein
LYDFNEPWTGPNNIKLESQCSWIWNCPSHDHGNKTTYKLVNGAGTAFEVGKKLRFDDVRDGSSNTIALIEDISNPVSWLEPGDFTAEAAAKVLNSIGKKKKTVRISTRRLSRVDMSVQTSACLMGRPTFGVHGPIAP